MTKLNFKDLLTIGCVDREAIVGLPEDSPKGELALLAVTNIVPVSVADTTMDKREVLEQSFLLDFMDDRKAFNILVPTKTIGDLTKNRGGIPELVEGDGMELLVVELDPTDMELDTVYSNMPIKPVDSSIPVYAVFAYLEANSEYVIASMKVDDVETDKPEVLDISAYFKHISYIALNKRVVSVEPNENHTAFEKAYVEIINNPYIAVRNKMVSIIYDPTDVISATEAIIFAISIGDSISRLREYDEAVKTKYVIDFRRVEDATHLRPDFNSSLFDTAPESFGLIKDIILASKKPEVSLDSRILTLENFLKDKGLNELEFNISNIATSSRAFKGVDGVFDSAHTMFNNTFRPYSFRAQELVESVSNEITNLSQDHISFPADKEAHYTYFNINDPELMNLVFKEYRKTYPKYPEIDVLANLRIDADSREFVLDVSLVGNGSSIEHDIEVIVNAASMYFHPSVISPSLLKTYVDTGVVKINKNDSGLVTGGTITLSIDKVLLAEY